MNSNTDRNFVLVPEMTGIWIRNPNNRNYHERKEDICQGEGSVISGIFGRKKQ